MKIAPYISFLLFCLLAYAPIPAASTTLPVPARTARAFYLSSSSGDDASSGTKSAPWKSLEKISTTSLQAGDSVLFKRGDRFTGHFVVNGSGAPDQPVVISAYGFGEKPILSGQVGATGGGDYQEAILVQNQDHLVFDGLEIQNERLVSREGVKDVDAYGMFVYNNGTEVMRDFTFRNLVFRNVFAVEPILEREDFDAIQVTGLRFFVAKNNQVGQEKTIRDITVENCFFTNLQRFGIQFKHSGSATGVGNDSINRIMNIVCRNNEFSYNGGTAILPNRTYNCLIENNIFDHPGASTDPRMPGRGSSVWNIYSVNTVIQYNMCLNARGYFDSYGIHIDHSNENTFVQYNYMEDCEGGFVEILRGNKNAVYRFNVSVNDGWRQHPTWKNSNHTIWVSSDRWKPEKFDLCDGVYVYNNTVVIDRPFTTSISLDGKNMFVYNNIFSATNGAGMGSQEVVVRDNDTPFFMRNNLFEGSVNQKWVDQDANPQFGAPLFSGTGEQEEAYKLQDASPAVNRGVAQTGPPVVGAGTGIFQNVPRYPTVDFFGNPVDLSTGTPNIGASNAKENVVSSVLTPKASDLWLVYPQAADSSIHIQNKGGISGLTSISLVNLKGQSLYRATRNIAPSERNFDIQLPMALANGIYALTIKSKGVSRSHRLVFYR